MNNDIKTYTYDERHNRLTKRIQANNTDTTDAYTMNQGDQLTERVKKHTQSQVVIEEEEYTYSDNGHMTSRVLTTGGNDYTTSYQYDVGGNLKQVTLPDSATVTYQYDAYGNRVKKQTSTEKVSYEYAGGSCQREIHRNLSDTILYTLRYYPWGFTKTIPGTPEVTTSYYYLVDTRGWVWGLTDGDGTILETYQYSPYGELLSTPTITHSRFLSGADECLWDSETGLYYLHARYYDPQLGRFIQEDIVEGDLESPASQNRYTYCQNDPVSLIDPSGYSPQNTNSLNRYNQFNIANLDSPYGCSLSDLQPVLPELTPSDGGEVIGPEEMYETYDGCSGLRIYSTRPSNSKMKTKVGTEDCGNYTITYGFDQYGNPIAEVEVRAESGGSKSMAEAIEKGINEGLWDLKQDGYFYLKDIDKKNTRFTSLIKEISKFAINNLKYFVESFLKGSDLNHSDRVSLFFKHATVGAAVGSLLCHNQIGPEKDPGKRGTTDENFNAYDTDIGFWASFYNDLFGMGLSLNGSDTNLGLVQWGNLTKSLFMQESNMDPKAYHSDTGGIGMSVAQKEVQGTNTILRQFGLGKNVHGFDWDDNKKNPNAANTSAFYNIGAGMGHFVAKLAGEAGLITYDRNDVPHMKSFNNMTLTYEMWGDAVAAWGPHSKEKPYPPLPFYRKEVMERYLQYNHR